MRKAGLTKHQPPQEQMNDSSLSIQPRKTSQEVAASASAALAKATIEAKFVIALQRPRSVLNARAAILDACKRPRFAEGAWYDIPNRGNGFTIRFAEQALNAWKNVDVQSVTAWENEDQRLVRITVTDLEQNLSYADEVLLNKTVERTRLKDGQQALSFRENSDGKRVYLVACTEDELLLKVNSAKSKVIRNSGLRLIPQDILEEAAEVIFATLKNGGEDTKATVKKITDGFGSLGVGPSDLEEYLGHKLESCSPKEIQTLRSIFIEIKDGESAWGDFVKPKPTVVEVKVRPSQDDQIPGAETPEKHPEATPEPRNVASEPHAKAQPPNSRLDGLRKFFIEAGISEVALMALVRVRYPETDSLAGLDDVEAIAPHVVNAILRNKAGFVAEIRAGAKDGSLPL
jgi:hypothetical protein